MKNILYCFTYLLQHSKISYKATGSDMVQHPEAEMVKGLAQELKSSSLAVLGLQPLTF